MVLGSGNMDRASWYTSQESGIVVEGEGIARDVWRSIERELDEGRMRGLEWLRHYRYGP